MSVGAQPYVFAEELNRIINVVGQITPGALIND